MRSTETFVGKPEIDNRLNPTSSVSIFAGYCPNCIVNTSQFSNGTVSCVKPFVDPPHSWWEVGGQSGGQFGGRFNNSWLRYC